jgi:hypothetical protein
MAKRKGDAQAALAAAGIAPRGLSAEQSAAYVGLSTNEFLAMVTRGFYPAPMRIEADGKKVRRRIWDREALDACMSGKAATDGRGKTIEEVAAETAAELRAGVFKRRAPLSLLPKKRRSRAVA